MCFYTCGAIGDYYLGVLTAGLDLASVKWFEDKKARGWGGHTRTVPEPNDAAQEPPTKEIQFLWPRGVMPTDTRGFNVTAMRKSIFKDGVGRMRPGWGMLGIADMDSLIRCQLCNTYRKHLENVYIALTGSGHFSPSSGHALCATPGRPENHCADSLPACFDVARFSGALLSSLLKPNSLKLPTALGPSTVQSSLLELSSWLGLEVEMFSFTPAL